MTSRTTKLFKIGNHQFVLLPESFNFEGNKIRIRKDQITGKVILSPIPNNWDGFIEAANALHDLDDFISDRANEAPQQRDNLL